MRRPLLRLLRRLRKTNRVVTVLMYTAFGLLTFFVSVSLSLPVDKIKDRIERELSQEPGPPQTATGSFGIGSGMDVSIGELDVNVFRPGFSATDVRLKPRKSLASSSSSEAPAAKSLRPIVIDRIEARVHPVDALFGQKSGRLLVEAFGGELQTSFSIGNEGVTASADLHDITLARLSALSQLLPLPMLGTLGLSLHFQAPNQRPAAPARPGAPPTIQLPPRLDLPKAVGDLDLKLQQATLGDGKAKLVVPGDAFLSQGLTFPRIRLGDVIGKVTIERGRASIADVHAKSPDVELWIDGYLELRDPLPLSEAHLYIRFKPSPQLTAREPTMEIVVSSQAQGKRSDGALGFAITGSLANPRARPAKEPPDGVVLRAGTLGQVTTPAQPSLQPGTPALPPIPRAVPMEPRPSSPAPAPASPSATETVIVPPPPQAAPPQAASPPPPSPMASAPPPGTLHVPPPGMQPPSPPADPPSHAPSSEASPHPSSEAPPAQ